MRNLNLNGLLGEKRSEVSFHDSEIKRIQLDYVKRQAIFDFHICAEDMDDNDWHSGRLIFSGLLFFVTEILDESYSYDCDALDINQCCGF